MARLVNALRMLKQTVRTLVACNGLVVAPGFVLPAPSAGAIQATGAPGGTYLEYATSRQFCAKVPGRGGIRTRLRTSLARDLLGVFGVTECGAAVCEMQAHRFSTAVLD